MDADIFGKSQFRGKSNDLWVQAHRWLVQFGTLLLKNFVVLYRRPLQMLLFLLLPSAVPFLFLLEVHGTGSEGAGDAPPPLYDPTVLSGLGACDAYYTSDCVQIAYGPANPFVDSIMQSFSDSNDLAYGADVLGFPTIADTEEYVAAGVGKVQFTVFFHNESLWDAGFDDESVGKNLSYVIFYNNSRNNDERSAMYNVNFPLLVLQHGLDDAFMKTAHPNRYTAYDASYGVLWKVPLEEDAESPPADEETTPCDWDQRHEMETIGFALPWVLVFSFLLMSNIPFQMVAEERRKKLFSMMRRLGLMDTAYWASWFVTFQILLLLACSIALLAAEIIGTQSSALRSIDAGVLFLILWLSGAAFVSLAFFLGAFCSTSSVSAALAFTQFLIALATISASTTSLNEYSKYFKSSGYADCGFVSSSYNRIYSETLPGNAFVEFLVFFLPWFHAAQAITDVLSVVQYKDQSFSMHDLYDTKSVNLLYDSDQTKTFTSEWVSNSLVMLVSNVLVYMAMAWMAGQLVTSEAGEGRSVLSVFLPAWIRRAVFAGEYDSTPQAGDIRGEEREKSRRDQCIRAYKVSKTYSGVQALKELSVTMRRGEVFVLLGHNGAGKSTLINVITGLIAPTHGKVYINGLDAETDVAEVQQAIGVCPQDDILWDDLTALEHMYLTAAFKGLEIGNCSVESALRRSIDSVLGKVQLLDRAGEFSKNYSGGMKRRLSIAMSTVGDVDVLFLDEPSTGLDPVSRRHVWDTITWMKKAGRVVVLTTHNMEEADYLADNIMIIHSGQVRAFGDPLFLKESYGRGYQMNLVVPPKNTSEVTRIMTEILPNSRVAVGFSGTESSPIGDESLSPMHGGDAGAVAEKRIVLTDDNLITLTVTVPRGDLRGFPRLFAWLERSKRAASLVKEWGISNTTLEEVFLQLCTQNREINYTAGNDNSTEKSVHLLCPMCKTRTREPVVCMRSPAGDLMAVPDALCRECADGNPYFKIDGDMAESLDLIPIGFRNSSPDPSDHVILNSDEVTKRRLALLAKSYARSEAAATQALLENEITGVTDSSIVAEEAMVAFEEEWKQVQKDENAGNVLESHIVPMNDNDEKQRRSLQVGEEGEPLDATVTEDIEAAEPDQSAGARVAGKEYYGSTSAQVKALMTKNVRLQYRQRCSNICSILFVGILFLMLYVMSLLFSSESGLEQCDQGYVTDRDCSLPVLVDHIFSADDGTMSDDYNTDDNVLGPNGYNVQYYLAPSSCGTNIQTFGATFGVSNTPGLTCTKNRLPIVWSSLLNTTDVINGIAVNGLYVSTRYPPSGNSDANAFMYNQQLAVLSDTHDNGYPYCSQYAPSTMSGTYSTDVSDLAQNFSNYFADSVFSCPSCQSVTPGDGVPSTDIFYEGSVWVADTASKSYCSTQDCDSYPFGYMNYKATNTDPYAEYYGDSCPAGVQDLQIDGYQYSAGLTVLSMTWINLLSNLLVDPTLINYPIQVGLSQYGELNFEPDELSQSEANILTVIGMLLMNGFWPTAVWRLSVERSQGIVLMMRTVGMRPESYLLGMFGFDMVISIISGVAMVGFAVGLELSQFDGAPVGYLIAVVILSAWALNAGIQLLVRVLGKRAAILPLIAPCALIAATAGVSLTNILVYPDEGDWPSALSIIPFFAQGRALYLILVYHDTSEEVDIALALLFVFGAVCLVVTYVIELDINIVHAVQPFLKGHQTTHTRTENSENLRSAQAPLSEEGVEKKPASTSAHSDSWWHEEDYATLDEDVAKEKHRSLLYDSSSDLPENNNCAIVIQKLRRTFHRNGMLFRKSTSSRSDDETALIVAVKELSLCLRYGECFGLLGPNGAGKSTTMSILSGTLRPSAGDIFLAGKDLQKSTDALHKYVGVCPQFDIVWNDLSVADHLSFQARQRGIPPERISAEVQQAAVAVGLDGDGFHTKAGQLSGGMRRRLSIAMSIVGNPPIIFMDEPTTGLDPDNRQHVWKIIQKLKSPNRLILLTTHSMEEAEALCSRIGIVAKGELKCVGTAQHLKQKFGKGYVLTINLMPQTASEEHLRDSTASADSAVGADTKDDLRKFVLNEIGHGAEGTGLMSAVNRTQKFLIQKSSKTTISEIFRLMELNKTRFRIREWGLSMSTLEDAFISVVENAETPVEMLR